MGEPEGKNVPKRIPFSERYSKMLMSENKYASNDEKSAKDYLGDLGMSWDFLKGKKVLDLGSAEPHFAGAAFKRGIQVTSLDLDAEECNKKVKSIRKKQLPYVAGSGHNLPFTDEAFDLVVARAVMHTLMCETENDLRNVLAEVKRVLRPGGEFRFGPGTLEIVMLKREQRQRMMDLLDKLYINGLTLTPEEDVERLALESLAYIDERKKVHKEYDQYTLSEEETGKKLKEESLKLLHLIDPNITMHTGAIWRGPEYDCYFQMTKLK